MQLASLGVQSCSDVSGLMGIFSLGGFVRRSVVFCSQVVRRTTTYRITRIVVGSKVFFAKLTDSMPYGAGSLRLIKTIDQLAMVRPTEAAEP